MQHIVGYQRKAQVIIWTPFSARGRCSATCVRGSDTQRRYAPTMDRSQAPSAQVAKGMGIRHPNAGTMIQGIEPLQEKAKEQKAKEEKQAKEEKAKEANGASQVPTSGEKDRAMELAHGSLHLMAVGCTTVLNGKKQPLQPRLPRQPRQ